MSTSLIQLINSLTKELTDQGFGNAKNEIIWYLDFLKICNKKQIYSDTIPINQTIQNALDIFYSKRITGMPFQYILGYGTFYGRDFFINEHVLIPRPETELFINKLQGCYFQDVLEVGTGSGILAITLRLENLAKQVLATDISPLALDVANYNIQQFNVSNVLLKKHDFLNYTFDQKFDLIISNPPYISLQEYNQLPHHIIDYEPRIALTDNDKGLLFYYRFADQLPYLLQPNGMFLCELGSASILPDVKQIFINKGYQFNLLKDFNNNDRIIQIQFSSKD